jgi:hypothetical protein
MNAKSGQSNPLVHVTYDQNPHWCTRVDRRNSTTFKVGRRVGETPRDRLSERELRELMRGSRSIMQR